LVWDREIDIRGERLQPLQPGRDALLLHHEADVGAKDRTRRLLLTM